MDNNTPAAPQIPPLQPVQPIPEPVYSPAPQTGTGVWISKEEYDRLRSAEVAPKPQPAVFGSGPLPEEPYQPPKDKYKDFWTYVSGAAAILVFLGLTSSFGVIFSTPLTIGLVIFSVLSITSLYKATTGKIDSGASPINEYRPKKTASKVVLTVLGVVILTPVLMIAGFMALLMVILSAPGSKGS
jgi:hypothetical protein